MQETNRAMPQRRRHGDGRDRETARAKIFSRRTILGVLAAVPLALAWELAANGRSAEAAGGAAPASGAPDPVVIVEFSDDGRSN